MGHRSGQICSFSTRSKDCRQCELGGDPETHDCRKNYNGSSKAMEQDMAIELYTNNKLFDDAQVYGARLVMDDDSTTIAGLQQVTPYNVIKWSDKNHACKNFKKSLYALKLSAKQIKYFSKNFVAAIENNKGDTEELKKTLKSIVPHAFGDHTLCSFHEQNKNYNYNNLPNNQPLQNIQLRTSLEDLLSRYIDNAEKLSPAASTQVNESFNNTMASKSPKRKHYSKSESFNFRMAAAVCQKNEGFSYLDMVCKEKLNISPSHNNGRYRQVKEGIKIRKKLFAASLEGKRIRRKNRLKNSTQDKAAEKRAGLSYQSNIGFDILPENSADSAGEEILHDIDPHNNMLEKFKLIFVDIETTGTRKSDQIVQVNFK